MRSRRLTSTTSPRVQAHHWWAAGVGSSPATGEMHCSGDSVRWGAVQYVHRSVAATRGKLTR
jgi:hypothetical protein